MSVVASSRWRAVHRPSAAAWGWRIGGQLLAQRRDPGFKDPRPVAKWDLAAVSRALLFKVRAVAVATGATHARTAAARMECVAPSTVVA